MHRYIRLLWEIEIYLLKDENNNGDTNWKCRLQPQDTRIFQNLKPFSRDLKSNHNFLKNNSNINHLTKGIIMTIHFKKNMILYWTLGDFLINHIVNSCTKYPCTNENLWQEAGSIEVRAGSNDVCSKGIAFMKMSGVQFPW